MDRVDTADENTLNNSIFFRFVEGSGSGGQIEDQGNWTNSGTLNTVNIGTAGWSSSQRRSGVGMFAKTMTTHKNSQGKVVAPGRVDGVSKILRIMGAGQAEPERTRLEKFGSIQYLDNHYIDKE